jgi:hypothetical protein
MPYAPQDAEIAGYKRPKNQITLTKSQREGLLREYFDHYRRMARDNPALLNQKLPRETYKALLDIIGRVLLERTKDLAFKPGPVREFIELNSLPPSLGSLLPPDFRAFCLALNALKQWVSAEQHATDRYLLGGNARNDLRAIAGSCIVTGRSLDGDCELHHPVRDGRPPVPLCHDAHDRIEQQGTTEDDSSDSNFSVISKIRRQNNNSWKSLRKGCLDLMGEQVKHSTSAVRAGALSFARKSSNATGLTFGEIIDLLDTYSLGLN